MTRYTSESLAPSPSSQSSLSNETVRSVQAMLYARLRARWGGSAGRLAWALIRCAQPAHREHASAIEAVRAMPRDQLGEIARIVNAARVHAGDGRPDAAALAGVICDLVVNAIG